MPIAHAAWMSRYTTVGYATSSEAKRPKNASMKTWRYP